MGLYLKYRITDDTGAVINRVLDDRTGLMADVPDSFIREHGVVTAGCQYISVRDIERYSGRTKKGLNDFETWCRLNNRLDLIKEYDTTKNTERIDAIGKSSGKEVWWKCSKCGYEWKSILRFRTVGVSRKYNPSTCPRCAALANKGRTTVEGANDFYTWCQKNNRMDLLKEYLATGNNPPPNKISAFNTSQVDWKCSKCGQVFTSAIVNRTKNGSGCRFCSSGGASSPELMIYLYCSEIFSRVEFRKKINGFEADVYIPELRLVIDYRGSYWHSGTDKQVMDYNKEVAFDTIGLRQIIIIESQERRIDGRNIYVFGSTKPEEMMILLIQVIKDMFGLPELRYSSQIFNDCEQKVKVMRNSKVAVNNITITHPEVAARWDYEKNGDFRPEMVTYGTRYKAWFKCPTCNQSYYAMIRKQTLGQGCSICNGHVVVTGYNDLATLYPEILNDWDWEKNSTIGLYPTMLRATSGREVYWKCKKCGYETRERISVRLGKSNGYYKPHRCMNCGNKYPPKPVAQTERSQK